MNAAPDTAVWSFGVESRAKTAGAALKQNNRSMNRMIVELKKLGVARADIRTENVSVFAYHRGTRVTGFIANNQVSVTVRALGKSGAIIAAVTAAGANNVFGPQLSIADQADLRKQAIDAAFEQAAQKAQDLAAKAGVTLGQVHSIAEGGAGGQFGFNTALAASAEAAPPISPGRQEVFASLVVTFLIQ